MNDDADLLSLSARNERGRGPPGGRASGRARDHAPGAETLRPAPSRRGMDRAGAGLRGCLTIRLRDGRRDWLPEGAHAGNFQRAQVFARDRRIYCAWHGVSPCAGSLHGTQDPSVGAMNPVEARIPAAPPSGTQTRGELLKHTLKGVGKPLIPAAPPSCQGGRLPIASGWMICPADFRARRHDPCPFKKPRCRPLAGSTLSAKDLWHPAESIRSASGRHDCNHPVFPISRGVLGRCEPRRAEGGVRAGPATPTPAAYEVARNRRTGPAENPPGPLPHCCFGPICGAIRAAVRSCTGRRRSSRTSAYSPSCNRPSTILPV
jgi:hypothetical protein